MKRTSVIVACLGLLAVFFGLIGCLPESKNPIAPVSLMRLDRRLEGVWQTQGDGRSTYYHFGARKIEGAKSWPWMDVVEVEHASVADRLNVSRLECLSAQIGSSWFLCFREATEGGKTTTASYNFLRYEIDWTGKLQLHVPDEKLLADAIRSGQIRGTVKRNSSGLDVRLTDSSEHIAAFIASPAAKDLFEGSTLRLRRIAKASAPFSLDIAKRPKRTERP